MNLLDLIECPEDAILEGDAVEVMRRHVPDRRVDLIVTDPAYESLEKHRSKGTTTRLAQSAASSNRWFPIFRNARLPALLAEMYRVLVDDAHAYIMCDEETCAILRRLAPEAGFTVWKSLIWVKTRRTTSESGAATPHELAAAQVRIGMGYHWRNSTERILFLEKGKRPLADLSRPDVIFAPRVDRGYPTEKPAELVEPLILNSSSPGELVLDPFAGSGVVGEVARRLDRHWLLVDVDTTTASARLTRNADMGRPDGLGRGHRDASLGGDSD